MVIEERWTIYAREGFAVGGEIIELRDETGALINLQDLSPIMRITGFGRDEEFSIESDNFFVVPPIAPQTCPTAWEFKLSVAQVTALKSGNNDFEVLIADDDDVLIGEMVGTIAKRK